ncbi:MAG: hypothetical protein ACR2OH_01745, partial [Microthrixaceae bacterium]
AELGETGTWVEWVDTDRVWLRGQGALSEINDGALTEAWGRYVQAEVGSVAELAALAEFNTRLAYLMLEPLAGE